MNSDCTAMVVSEVRLLHYVTEVLTFTSPLLNLSSISLRWPRERELDVSATDTTSNALRSRASLARVCDVRFKGFKSLCHMALHHECTLKQYMVCPKHCQMKNYKHPQ